MKLYILCFKDLTLTDIFEFEGNAWDLLVSIHDLLKNYEKLAVIEHNLEVLLEFQRLGKFHDIVYSEEFKKHGIFRIRKYKSDPTAALFYIDTSKYADMYEYRMSMVEFHLPTEIFLVYQRIAIKREELERVQDVVSFLDYLFTFLEV